MTSLTIGQVLPLLLEAAPGFGTAWREHLGRWGDEDRGDYIDAGEFARYVVRSHAQGRTGEFAALFAAIERILRDGDGPARNLAAVGILEGIQCVASHHTFGARAFLPWLLPRSRKAWDEIDAAWQAGGGSLAGVIRRELGTRDRRWWEFWKGRPPR